MRINLILSILLLIYSTLACADYPEAKDEYINDFANVIDPAALLGIRKKLYDTEYYSGVEISVVTINNYSSYNTNDRTWEEFSTSLFNRWHVGNIKHNDGVLFLISKEDRKIRIEIGQGFESHYDSIMKSIIDDKISPLLKEGNFTRGIDVGVDEIISATTVKVSFFEWYKWYFFAGFIATGFIIAAFRIDREKHPVLFKVLIGVGTAIFIGIFKKLLKGNRSDGFGGGSSSGGGSSGDF